MKSIVRRVASVLALLIAGTTLTAVAAAPPADAAAVCTLRPVLPSRVAIADIITPVTMRVEGCPGTLKYAYWGLSGPTRYEGGSFIFDGSRTARTLVWDNFTTGAYRTVKVHAWDTSNNALGQSETSTTVKYAGWAGVAARRSSSATTVTVAAKRYDDYMSHGFVGYSGRVVGVQSAPTSSGPWTVAGYVRVGATGRGTLNVAAPAGRYYRSFFGEATTTWGATSAPVRA